MLKQIRPRNSSRLFGICLVFSLIVLSLTYCSLDDTQKSAAAKTAETHNILTDAEKTDGWILLFDGKSFAGWRGLGREEVPAGHWTIEDDAIKKIPSAEVPLQDDGQPLQGGDLLTVDTYLDFEFSFEWKISPAGNSGIKYNVSEEMSTTNPPRHAALGFEYQVLDDDLHADALVSVTHQAGALYNLKAAEAKVLMPVGEYNTARILFQGKHAEHWLNGKKILEYDLDSEDMRARLQKSKYRGYQGFADKRTGHIVLQDHTDAVWFRNLKLRRIKEEGQS